MQEKNPKESLSQNLYDTLMCHKIAKYLGLDQGNETYSSNALSELFGQDFYISKGYDEFRDSIKGYAVIGFVWNIIKERYHELKKMDIKKLREIKKDFLKTRKNGSQFMSSKDFKDEMLDDISSFDIAIWEKFRNRPIITTTSGSFGIATLKLMNCFYNKMVVINGTGFPLLHPDKEGEVIVFSPEPNSGLITEDKAKQIQTLVNAIHGCSSVHYNKFTGTMRDRLAFIMTLRKNGYLFLTNPQSKAEIQKFADVINKLPTPIPSLVQFLVKNSLETIGIKTTFFGGMKATKSLTCGIDGLAIMRLKQLEYILKQNPNVQKITTYNQPSVGATFAGILQIDEILQEAIQNPDAFDDGSKLILAQEFPILYKKVFIEKSLPILRVKATFDAANTALADRYGYDDVYNTGLYPKYPHNNNPPNGLGTITTGEGCTEVMDRHLKTDKPSFNGGSDMHIVPHNFSNVAQVLMFVANYLLDPKNARIPELAGAASLGGLMHRKFLKGKIKPDDYVKFLLNQRITKDIFFKIVDEKYFLKESQTHGGKADLFSKDLLNLFEGQQTINYNNIRSNPDKSGGKASLFSKDLLNLFEGKKTINCDNLLSSPDKSKAYIITSTGSNGMEAIEANVKHYLVPSTHRL